MPRLSDLDLGLIRQYADGTRTGTAAQVDQIYVDGKPLAHETVTTTLVSEVFRLRELIARAHPYLDAMAAPQALQDELGAEVREIAADRLARAHAAAGGDAEKPE